ncbi:hypothetical protein HPP92_006964 [Vanilla planifolia]|uniref:Pentatricopeptide repeat-containing protein n=1 Tax=Vanilla planifolia TaxID=51239 RepID=A0A835V886_VANPL|nr:hypothetical protein HPP92_006964 [Vanilla planifolia]
MRSLSLPLSSSTFAAIISSYADACLPDLAVEVFNRMRHFSCSQTTEVYNALLSALSRSRNFHGAYALVRRMHRRSVPRPPDLFHFGRRVVRFRKLREAQDFLEEMARLGFSPPVRGRDLLIDGLVSAGHLESAKRIVLRMTKEGPSPTSLPSTGSLRLSATPGK